MFSHLPLEYPEYPTHERASYRCLSYIPHCMLIFFVFAGNTATCLMALKNNKLTLTLSPYNVSC